MSRGGARIWRQVGLAADLLAQAGVRVGGHQEPEEELVHQAEVVPGVEPSAAAAHARR
eukprot:SAG11_NODE_23047_length_396_cov_0.626263_1_plen_57_part_10